MNDVPMISVVMSVFNGEIYLSEAIDSILNQTYTNFEFIIINDGSYDKSLDILQAYQKKDKRIIVINRDNRGLVVSLNEGIRKARGTYIARMDADDISVLTRFEKQVAYLEKNMNVGVCGTWVEMMKETQRNSVWKLPLDNNELQARLIFSVPFVHPSVMIRKTIIDNYQLFYKENYKNAEDYMFWVECSQYTEFANLPEVLLFYRYLDTSITRRADSFYNEERFQTMSAITIQILKKLSLNISEDELKLHFTLVLNQRIKFTSIDTRKVYNYLFKLIKANEQKNLYDRNKFNEFIAKKYFIVVLYQVRRYNVGVFFSFMHKLFWMGLGKSFREKFISRKK